MEWDKEKIKALRKKLNLTQPQLFLSVSTRTGRRRRVNASHAGMGVETDKTLAELLGTSQVLISYWETGRGNPSSISQKFGMFQIPEKISLHCDW